MLNEQFNKKETMWLVVVVVLFSYSKYNSNLRHVITMGHFGVVKWLVLEPPKLARTKWNDIFITKYVAYSVTPIVWIDNEFYGEHIDEQEHDDG